MMVVVPRVMAAMAVIVAAVVCVIVSV